MPVSTHTVNKLPKVLLIGGGALAETLVVALRNLGAELVACNNTDQTPIMRSVSNKHLVDFEDTSRIMEIAAEEKPDIILPEIARVPLKAIEALHHANYNILPRVWTIVLLSNRQALRDLASKRLKLPTVRSYLAKNFEQLTTAAEVFGCPCVVKPYTCFVDNTHWLVESRGDLGKCWEFFQTQTVKSSMPVVVEAVDDLECVVQLLVLRSEAGTFFCHPDTHYRLLAPTMNINRSCVLSKEQLRDIHDMAYRVTERIADKGAFLVEFALTDDGRPFFSDVAIGRLMSDSLTTSMSSWNHIELYARAILNLPISDSRRGTVQFYREEPPPKTAARESLTS